MQLGSIFHPVTKENTEVMRPQRLLLLVIVILSVVASLVLIGSQTARSALHNSVDLIGFFFGVAAIAPILWALRSVVESQPDPFFLNLTFYAFAGQCIRTGEAIATRTFTNRLFLLLVLGVLLLILEVFVTKTHEKVTIKHYKSQLRKAKNGEIPEGEFDRWAKLLVKISGTDFSPGSYRWLKWLSSLFEVQTKEESKVEAVGILDGTQFNKKSEFLTPTGLTVSKPEQTLYWLPYILIPVGSWFIFGWTLFASR
jgi:uncharacterized membrane protein